jgi:hypothetical protein
MAHGVPSAVSAMECHNGHIMTTERKTSGGPRSWSDPLSMGFEAHRRLLLLRLRLRGSSARRERHGLLAARRNRSAADFTASATSGGSSTSNSAPTLAK